MGEILVRVIKVSIKFCAIRGWRAGMDLPPLPFFTERSRVDLNFVNRTGYHFV